ncbi:MAG: ATP-binding protein [Myxococcota bacterium]
MPIRAVTAAQVRRMRRATPPAHLADEDAGAIHLGAFEEEQLVGGISGLPVSPEGPAAPGVLEVHGPFGDHGEALVEALASRLPPGGWLWSSVPCPGLSAREGRWELRAPSYTAEDIEVLSSVEAIRKRPGMYVGGTGPKGLFHLLLELVSNSVDEHLAGHASQLSVHLGRAGITVEDDGRGIPVDLDPTLLETLCTCQHAGSTLEGQQRAHVHVGAYGLGLVVLSALSSALAVTVDRGRRYQQVFVRGRPVGSLVDAGPAVARGTSVTFVPDAAIFGAAEIERQVVSDTLGDLAVLNPALRIELDSRLLPSHGGLLGLARTLSPGPISREWSTRATSDGITVEIAICWSSGPPLAIGWANQLRCVGSHLDGLAEGLEGTPTEGRVALIAVALAHLAFAGRTRERLQVEEVRELVSSVVRRAMG